ncbi:hypothetical protein QR680_011469 [Steinernema hermaphroditum]|uniref:BTB domain-containing protein n=1 Tax=Steinernema hermaphroditum TaxID=289476 RepID=A0AA39I0W4_9BILA|nr:hypothetical protein QR680_011469 [Steinernema hermaphroditum]
MGIYSAPDLTGRLLILCQRRHVSSSCKFQLDCATGHSFYTPPLTSSKAGDGALKAQLVRTPLLVIWLKVVIVVSAFENGQEVVGFRLVEASGSLIMIIFNLGLSVLQYFRLYKIATFFSSTIDETVGPRCSWGRLGKSSAHSVSSGESCAVSTYISEEIVSGKNLEPRTREPTETTVAASTDIESTPERKHSRTSSIRSFESVSSLGTPSSLERAPSQFTLDDHVEHERPESPRISRTLVCKNQGVITVTVDVTIRRQKKFALDQFVEGMADLKIELDLGMELFVSKLFLCAHSAVFSNMMNSTFVEGQTGVCKLPGVKYHIFMIVLHRFYGFPIDFENLNDDDLTDVIEFANRFQFDLLLTEIENYLMSLNATKRRKWFDVAEHYTLIALLNSILKTMTFCEVQTLYHKAKSEGFGNLNQKYSNETVDAILGRLCSNNPNNYEWNS